MASVAEKLKGARLPELRVPVCVRGDLVARLQELQGAYDQAAKDAKAAPADDRLADDDEEPGAGIKAEIETVKAEMRGATSDWVLRAINPDVMDAIVLAHPPKTDEDKLVGYDFEPARNAILRESLVDPVVASDDDWHLIRTTLSLGQFQDLVSKASELANAKPTAPF